MPLIRISLLKGKSPERIKAISASVHLALVESFGMHPDDLFQTIEQLASTEFLFDRQYMTRTPRSDDFMIVHIKAGAGDIAAKEALYNALVAKLADSPGISPQDVLVSLDVNPALENWSFGNGVSLANGI